MYNEKIIENKVSLVSVSQTQEKESSMANIKKFLFHYVGLEKPLYDRLEQLEFEKNEKLNLKKEDKAELIKNPPKKPFFETVKIRKVNLYEVFFIIFSIILMGLSISSMLGGFNSKALLDNVNLTKNFTNFRTNVIEYNNTDVINLLENLYNQSYFLNYSPLRVSIYTVDPEEICDKSDVKIIESLKMNNYYCSPEYEYNSVSKKYLDLLDNSVADIGK